MSRTKCHRESYESGGSLRVVSRLVRMNKICWSILLEDKQKAKCGGVDKSQIYIYLVFCIVYHLFWAFLCLFLSCRWCSHGKIEEQAKNSKKESKEVKMGKVQEHVTAWFCHAAAWGLPVKNPRLACRSMPWQVQKPDFLFMSRHDDADRTMLFLASRVLGLLCNTPFFISIKKSSRYFEIYLAI